MALKAPIYLKNNRKLYLNLVMSKRKGCKSDQSSLFIYIYQKNRIVSRTKQRKKYVRCITSIYKVDSLKGK